jgi:hypothetical protein
MTGFNSKRNAAADRDALFEKLEVEQPAQEPLATVTATVTSESGNPDVTMSWWHEPALPVGTKLYTIPPQREWVDLIDSQIEQVYYDVAKLHRGASMPWGQVQFGRALQALIKEKNSD